MTPAIFLDRDGVINQNRADYVKSWAEVLFLPGAFEALRRLAQTPYRLVIITNQSAIGRGIITLQTADEINRRLVGQIEAHGGRVDGVYLCPHHPQAGCACRKPQPGMLLRAASELKLDLPRSYLIGDARSDLKAARAAGVQGILVRTGRGTEAENSLDPAERALWPVLPDLSAAVDYILAKSATSS